MSANTPTTIAAPAKTRRKSQPVSTQLDRLVIKKEAGVFLGGVSDDTLEDWIRDGKLPPLIRLSPRVAGWRQSTLERVLADAARGAA